MNTSNNYFGRKIAAIMVIVAICITFGTSGAEITYADNSYQVNVPSRNLSGYDEKRTTIVKYNCDQPLIAASVDRNEIVGYCHAYIGIFREEYNGKYYDAVVVKCGMEPQKFKNTKGKIYYGFSQYLDIMSYLPSHATYQYNTPNNTTTGSKSYSIGFTGGYQAAAVSGTINMDKAHCKVTDESKVSKNLFDISYDYKSNGWDISSNSKLNKALFEQTWQFATCEWTTSKDVYNIELRIYAKFGASSSKNGAGMLGPLTNYSSYQSNWYSDLVWNNK